MSRVSKENGTCVKILENSGASVLVRGNIPQLLMSFDSDNNIFGKAKNPWDLQRVVGGSSGGEAGLVASRCIPLGLGSDIGGSVRVPPAFCGVVGFKPTTTRISSKGHTNYCDAIDG